MLSKRRVSNCLAGNGQAVVNCVSFRCCALMALPGSESASHLLDGLVSSPLVLHHIRHGVFMQEVTSLARVTSDDPVARTGTVCVICIARADWAVVCLRSVRSVPVPYT